MYALHVWQICISRKTVSITHLVQIYTVVYKLMVRLTEIVLSIDISWTLSCHPRSPGNPSMCLHLQQPASIPLHRLPKSLGEKNICEEPFRQERFGATQELDTPCVCGLVYGLWTQSAGSSRWGQNWPRMPPGNAGRSLGMTILGTVIN